MSASRRWGRFVVVVALTAALLAWAGRTTWREVHQLRRSFAAVEGGSFHLAEAVETSLRDMNEEVFEYVLHGQEASRAEFLKNGDDLKQRLVGHNGFATQEEKDIVTQIRAALDVYLAEGLKLMEEGRAGSNAKPVADRVQQNTQPMFELCSSLLGVERAGLSGFIKQSHESLTWLEGLLITTLVLLLGLGAAVAASAYRELLLPLRSELRQSRSVIERHEKLASLGTLAAGVAHEIRNPLTAINVRVHSLKRNLLSGSSEYEDAGVIESEIRRLEGIVQAFLQFARPSEPKFVTVSADSLLAKVRALCVGTLEKMSIHLILDSPSDFWVRVDPQQVEQVLINLVQNAAESIQRDGTIRLRARSDSARLAGKNRPVVILEVSDTGKGIPPEVQKRLFDPFFTTKPEGTGLGLSIASRIVEQQGGALQFTSQANRGTTFSILLPAEEPPKT